jgi:hypothetical protein
MTIAPSAAAAAYQALSNIGASAPTAAAGTAAPQASFSRFSLRGDEQRRRTMKAGEQMARSRSQARPTSSMS